MQIQNMALNDYPAVYQLWPNAPAMGLNDADDALTGIARFFRRNPNTCFVATEEGRVIGAMPAGHDGRRGTVYHTAAAAGRRGRGVGRELVRGLTGA